MVNRVTVIKASVYNGSGDISGSGKVKSMTDTTEFPNMVIAGAR